MREYASSRPDISDEQILGFIARVCAKPEGGGYKVARGLAQSLDGPAESDPSVTDIVFRNARLDDLESALMGARFDVGCPPPRPLS